MVLTCGRVAATVRKDEALLGMVSVSRILPPKEDQEMVTTSLRMPRALIAELEAVAKESGYTRSDVIVHFCRWALEEYKRERVERKRSK
jgi:hypothetical protein